MKNNLLIGDVIRIKLLGDVDNNDVVDIFDIVYVASRFT